MTWKFLPILNAMRAVSPGDFEVSRLRDEMGACFSHTSRAVLDACRGFGLVPPDAPTRTGPDTFLAMIQDPDGNWLRSRAARHSDRTPARPDRTEKKILTSESVF